MVIGDFNGRIGPEDAKFTYHDITNRNGKFLVDLAIEKNMICANTYFRKRKGKLWTFCSPAGNKYQLDYILLRKKWRNSLLNAEAYNTFASVGSDHRIVTSRIRLSLRKTKTLPRGKNHDWKTLCSDSKLQELYTVEVHNRFQPLEEMEETATERYERFIKANREAAEKVIPVKKKNRKVRLSSDIRVVRARDDIRETYDAYQLDATERNRHRYKETKANLEEAYNTATEEDLSKRLRAVEEAHDNCKHGQSWKLINEITGRKASVQCSPPEIYEEDEDIVLLAKDLNINVAPFSQEEYAKAKTALVEGKRCGEDGVPPEVLKRCDLDGIVLEFCNNALIKGSKPEQWSILNIVPIPKSGDLSQAGNYRGISLSSVVAKIFNKMILNRIRPGFRVGRTTVSHILALRRIIEGVKAKNLPAIITFIDFRKAFDTFIEERCCKFSRPMESLINLWKA
ncbi:uncharacterized protein [Amphiura filiformis]|uniref:uncharacterized protein n=1 Tax=Amphiura filiformis TaxID=82378 RepID=UPI003B218B7F